MIYEAAGKSIPMTGEGLYAAIAIAVNGSEELLPWRRNHVSAPTARTKARSRTHSADSGRSRTAAD